MAKYITLSITLSILGLAYIGYENKQAMLVCLEKYSSGVCKRLVHGNG